MQTVTQPRPTWKVALHLVALLYLGLWRAAPASAQRPEGERELVVMVEEDNLSAWQELEDLAEEFCAREGHLNLKLLPLGGAAGARDKVKFLMAGDLQLDLVRIDITELAAFVAEGALIDLEPYFRRDSTWEEAAYFSEVLNAIRDERGHLFGLPSTFTPYVMYANLDLLERAGFDPPAAGWTWQDLLAITRAATIDHDGDGRPEQYGISLTQWLQAVAPWIWQNGGELLSADGQRSALGEPAVTEAFAFLRSLLHEEKVASFDASFANQLSQGLFQAGKAALYGPVGYWETYRFKSIEHFRWDVVPLPVGKQAATAVAMTVYVVPRTARQPELAYRFLRELAGPRYQRMLAEIGNGVPGLRLAAESASFLKPTVAPESEHVFLAALAHARFLPPLSNWRKIESLLQAELGGVLVSGEIPPAEACRKMAEKTDRYLAREAARKALPPLRRASLEVALAVGFSALLGTILLWRKRRGSWSQARDSGCAGLALLPWAAGFLLFFLVPALASAVLALCEWSPLRPLAAVRWVGGENFARLASDPTYHTSIGVTLLYVALAVPGNLILALALALLLRQSTTWNSLVRTIVYLPAILSPVIVAAVWRFLLDAEQGWVNEQLALISVTGPAWLRDSNWVLFSFLTMSAWSVGAQMLVFLAALQAIDPTLEQAARIDGAGFWNRLLYVLLPSLSPILLFNGITGSIAALQIFTQPYIMTQGGPGDASRFLILYLFETAFQHLDMGYASAQAWVLVLLSALFCAALLRFSARFVHYAGKRPA